jgi:hypothetical protein
MCNGGGGYGVLGLRQINNSRKVRLQVNFFRRRHFACPSMSLSFLWIVLMAIRAANHYSTLHCLATIVRKKKITIDVSDEEIKQLR